MGAQLSGIAPQYINPVEYYLSDITNSELISFDCNLGSTRFFKVARIKLHSIRPHLATAHSGTSLDNYNGFGPPSLGVAKVFVINDPSLPLKVHKEKIEYLREVLKENANALPFSKLFINEKAAILLRQYIKFNLYDRLSTRPFLTFFEKKWICFQLLKSVQWMHQRFICHGDIKLENILVTSYLWVLITDFASFKPVYLPEDNPADFSYFFDTSRRRTCNVAPERFIHEGFSQVDTLPSGSTSPSSGVNASNCPLAPSMDLFSLGCVLAELFSEDSPNNSLFDLSRLLQYKMKDKQYEGPVKVVLSIPDEHIRTLILNLIELDPILRNSTSQHLRELTPSFFPSYFSNLFDYIRDLLQLSPDVKIVKLSRDLDSLISMIVNEDSQGLILLVVIVTSSIRSLKHVFAKITALRLIRDLIKADVSVVSIYILDRILPYLMSMLNDKSSTVRSETIESLTYALSCVKEIPPSNNNVFPDFILPSLCQIVNDKSVLVRISLASHLSTLAQTSLRFLTSSSTYNSELQILQETFQSIVSHLLTDPENSVKITLLSSDISKLCTFFGKQKTNDIILSHIVTFLNEKEGFELRCSFFDSVVPISTFLGSQSSPILKPLLQQGIADPEETVIFKTLVSLSSLVELNLLNKNILFELVTDAIPLLCHPNLWIRHAITLLILTVSSQISIAEVTCKLMPLVKPYLQREIHSLKSNTLLLDSLEEHIPRSIYDIVISRSNSAIAVDQLFEYSRRRKMLKSIQRHHVSTVASELSGISSQLYEKLVNEGLNEKIEDKLLQLSDLIRRITRSLKSLPTAKVNENQSIFISKKNRKLGCIQLGDQIKSYGLGKSKEKQLTANMNEEWLQMFGSDSQKDSSDSSVYEIEGLQESDAVDEENSTIPVAHEAKESSSEKVIIQCPPCVNDLNNLIDHRRELYYELVSSSSGPCVLYSTGKNASSSYRPRGILIAHLQEHSAGINQVISIGETTLFITCSADSSIKVWDSSKMDEGKSIINRSKQTFTSPDPSSAAEGMTFCSAFDTLIAYTMNNSLYILQIEGKPSKMKILQKLTNFNRNSSTSITDISSISPHAFILSTTDSKINAYDLRQPLYSPVLNLGLSPFEGLITSINGCEYCIFCGTATGILVTFDIRFSLRANTMSYPTKQRIRKLLYTGDGLFSAVQNNNEVSLWDCETASRRKTLWASSAPPFSRTQTTTHSVLGMASLTTKDTNSLITCGTDMRIRYWDLLSPHRSYIINDCWKTPPLPSATTPVVTSSSSPPSVNYSSKFIEGIQVIQEHYQQQQHHNHYVNEQHVVSPSHKDCITDLTWIQKNNILVTVSRDGVVKLWK
ncbi:hypothetical protein B4U79_02231 [Dinothrombium tinctorium]|uniref:non-specific serine/threonine protein kinase n=1 Tax=Dinothrombium tinctorium TaxID=1965070 RepID=A0A3S3PYW3_9ACAR|nr:hypothetical protein B4U79_03150 [Dinothrombium tinctorium]RWS10689.1 hypothetical protein B4U79_02231 [Dinothrombium tinctorium]